MTRSKDCPFCGQYVNPFRNTGHSSNCFMNEVKLKKEALPCDDFLKLWNTRTSISINEVEMLIKTVKKDYLQKVSVRQVERYLRQLTDRSNQS